MLGSATAHPQQFTQLPWDRDTLHPRITSRIAFFVCGLISLLTGVPYAMLRGVDLPVQSEWVIFVVALGLVGLFSLAVALLPRSWIANVCKKDRDYERLFSAPLKLLGGFAAISYLLALVAYFAPHGWNLNPQVMLALCPMYLVKMTFDPSPVSIFLLLAPMNAALYGSLGVTLAVVRKNSISWPNQLDNCATISRCEASFGSYQE